MKKKIDVGAIRASLKQLNSLVSKDINYPVRFLLEETEGRDKHQWLRIESEPLPESFFGIFSKMISEATVYSFNPINFESGEIVFIPHFSYDHYGHGTNGHELYDPCGMQYRYQYKAKVWKRIP